MRWCLLLLLASCTLGPDFHKPDVEMPTNWQCSNAPQTDWWWLFKDPLLVELIEESVSCSYDAQIAQTRLCHARAERKKNLAHRWPFVGINFDTSQFNQSDRFPFVTTERNFSVFETAFDASWEVNIFGKFKRGQEALDAAVNIVEEQRHATQLSLIVEVARHYFDLRHVQAQKGLTQKVLILQKSLLADAKLANQAQLGTNQMELQLMQKIDSTENRLLDLEANTQLLMNQIAFMVNGMPGSLNQRLSTFGGLPSQPNQPPLGLPSDLLCRRPDLRMAELQLAYKTAHIGIALADFFPKFDLFADIGYLSTLLPKLIRSSSFNGIYDLLTRMPLFQGGKLVAQLNSAKAEELEALLEYTKAALGAYHEVDAALVQYKDKVQKLNNLQEIEQRSLQLVENQQLLEQEELISKDSVKMEQLKQLQFESSLYQGKAALLEQTLSLYKALGGGWELF